MGWFSLVLLAVLGGFMLVNPRLLWKIEHLFTVKGGEPTEAYLALMRVGGAVILLGIAVAVIALVAGPLLS